MAEGWRLADDHKIGKVAGRIGEHISLSLAMKVGHLCVLLWIISQGFAHTAGHLVVGLLGFCCCVLLFLSVFVCTSSLASLDVILRLLFKKQP